MDQYHLTTNSTQSKPPAKPKRDEDLVRRVAELERQLKQSQDTVQRLEREVRRLGDTMSALAVRMYNRG